MAIFGLFPTIDDPTPEQIEEGRKLEESPVLTLAEKWFLIALAMIIILAVALGAHIHL